MQVAKWGNSLAVRLPKKLVDELGLQAGDEVELIHTGSARFDVVRTDEQAQFLEKLRSMRRPAPEGFRWDRDEANER